MRYTRFLSWILYVSLLIILGFFAKDNLVAELRNRFLSDEARMPTAVPTVGTIEVAFSPNKGATEAIIRAVNEAQKSIVVAAYTFTSKDIAKALLDAKKRNVDVKVVLDKSQVSQKYSSAQFFANQDFALRIDVKHAIYHHKFLIIDDKTVVTGSFNFTKAAETKNAENILIIRNNPELANRYTEIWQLDWNRALPFLEFKKRLLDK